MDVPFRGEAAQVGRKRPVHVNPFRCRMWEFHDRIDDYVTEETCRGEIDSFLAQGQLVPALGRSVTGDPDIDVELIYGARRLFVARLLNKPLLVEIRDMSDSEAIAAMDSENRLRRDVSPYERGMSYARWLRSNQFKAQEDIAHALKISPSKVSRLLRLAKLPSVIVNAFQSPADICEGWGLALVDALEDTRQRQAMIRRARAIAALPTRPPARLVYRDLMATCFGVSQRRGHTRDEVVRDAQGAALFRIRQQRHTISFVLPHTRACFQSLEQIREFISETLQGRTVITTPPAGTQPRERIERELRVPVRRWLSIPTDSEGDVTQD